MFYWKTTILQKASNERTKFNLSPTLSKNSDAQSTESEMDDEIEFESWKWRRDRSEFDASTALNRVATRTLLER